MSAATSGTAPPKPPKNLLALVGPTGAGKSELAVLIAERIDAEILCVDAYQVYRGMAVLTAQPDSGLRARVKHHLYGEFSPHEVLDAAIFARRAQAVMDDATTRGVPILLVGGSGLYLRALLGGFDPLPPVDAELRAALRELGLTELLRRLADADPHALETVDAQNPRRVQRALEIVLQTGLPLSASRKRGKQFRVVHHGWLAARSREELRLRIETNVARMFEEGVIEEVRQLGTIGETASRAIGWQHIHQILAGRLTPEEACVRIVADTRAYAKRQLTWFRNQTSYPEVTLTGSLPPSGFVESVADLVLGAP